MSEYYHAAEWEWRPCPICGEVDALQALEHRTLQLGVDDGYFIFEQYDTVCRRCGFVFNGKIPDENFIRMYYEKSVIRVGDDYDANARLKLIKSLFPIGSRLIEFGSGRGEFSKRLEKEGYTVSQFDYMQPAVIENNHDGALAYYVLEHVIDPSGFIRKMRTSLKDCGVVIIEVPDYTGFTEHSLYHEHMNHFTIQHLITLLTVHNFHIFQILPGHSRNFGFAIAASTRMSSINNKKYFDTMKRIRNYWKAKHVD